MGMLAAIQDHIKEENLTPSELTEMMFIDTAFDKITAKDMKSLAQFENLEFINFAEVGLKSIEAPFPALDQCTAVLFSNNHLGDEAIETLTSLENLESLAFDGNRISSLEKFSLLSGLSKLKEISLSDCPVASTQGYREKLFKLLPQLEIVDDQDKEGNIIEEEETEDDDSFDEDDEEEVFDETGSGEAAAELGEFFGHELDDEKDDEKHDEDDDEDYDEDDDEDDAEDEDEDDDEDKEEEDDSSPANKKVRS